LRWTSASRRESEDRRERGPTDGVQPIANATPASTGAIGPPMRGQGSRSSRSSVIGRRIPAKTRPAKTINVPATISSDRRCSISVLPNHAAPAPSATNMAEKPAANQAVVTVTRRGCVPNSSTPTPETYERYPGTNGRTHGEVNERNPAAKAVANPAGPNSITRRRSPVSARSGGLLRPSRRRSGRPHDGRCRGRSWSACPGGRAHTRSGLPGRRRSGSASRTAGRTSGLRPWCLGSRRRRNLPRGDPSRSGRACVPRHCSRDTTKPRW
jgi:hypothetical protein